MDADKPVVLAADETRRRLGIALARAGQEPGDAVSSLKAADSSALATLPTWIAEFGLVAGETDDWLYAARVVGESPDDPLHRGTEAAPAAGGGFAAGQFVLRAGPGLVHARHARCGHGPLDRPRVGRRFADRRRPLLPGQRRLHPHPPRR